MAVTAIKEGVSQLKRRLILEASARLFSQRGYAATRIEDITEELSSSRRAIYDHFSGKAEILVEICEQAVRFSVDLAGRVHRESGSPSEKLRRIARDFTAICIENRDYIAISAREKHLLPAESQRRIRRMQEKFDRILGSILTDGARTGEFAPIDPALLALAIAGMIIWVHTWYREAGRLSAVAVADAMAEAALRMVVAGTRENG